MTPRPPGRNAISYSSRLVPYIPDEPHGDRHRRRFAAASAGVEPVAKWCEFRGVEFKVVGVTGRSINDVWFKFRRRLVGDAAIARWCPATGRAEKTRSARTAEPTREKIHDWEQLLAFLEDWSNTS